MRVCVFCPRPIQLDKVVCYEHAQMYLTYRNEPWLKELLRLEDKQVRINRKESIPIENAHNIISMETNQLGRRKIDHDLVFRLRECKMPFRDIALLLHCPIISVKKIVYRKRKIPVRKYTRKIISDNVYAME